MTKFLSLIALAAFARQRGLGAGAFELQGEAQRLAGRGGVLPVEGAQAVGGHARVVIGHVRRQAHAARPGIAQGAHAV